MHNIIVACQGGGVSSKKPFSNPLTTTAEKIQSVGGLSKTVRTNFTHQVNTCKGLAWNATIYYTNQYNYTISVIMSLQKNEAKPLMFSCD